MVNAQKIRTLFAGLVAGGLLGGALWAQPTPGAAPSATNSSVPAAKKPLPPLKLPDIPEGSMDEGEDEPEESPETAPWDRPEAPPAAVPPPPLPMPQGPPVVNAALPAGQRFWFRMEYDGKLAGYSAFEVTGRMSLADENSWILKSRSRLKLGVGSKDDATFESKLMVDTKTLSPTFFIASQAARGSNFEVTCIYSKTMVVQTNKAGDQSQQHFHSYTEGVPKLLFNNLWGHLDTFPEHYWLLVRSAVKGGVIKAYDPILRGGGQIVVYAPIAQKWKLDGKELSTLVYPVSDMGGTLLARVRVEARSLELLEVDEVGSGIVLRRCSPAVVAEVDKLQPLDLMPRRVASSNVLFPEPEKLTGLEAEVELHLRGGNLVDHQISGYRQYFTGEIGEGKMKGRVVVRSVPSDAKYKTKYPFRTEDKPPAEVAEYLKSSPGVESEWPGIQNKALELTWKSASTFVAARKLLNYCTQIEEGVSLPSARYAMESGVGNPESKALLLVALARGAGLPARPVGGLLYRDGSFVPHHWAEVWLGPEEGWAAFDPTTAEAGRIGAAHIALWTSGDIQSMDLKVVNYSPRAPRKVAFFNRELSWSVGEERSYDIMKKGQKIGQEVAAVRELIVDGDDDLYRFESVTRLQDGASALDSTSELMVNPNGLPVRFSMKGLKGQLKNETFAFKKDTARLDSQGADGKTKSREIPFSLGTYFTDSRFLTQWALVLGQALDESPEKQPKVGDKITFFTFVPETMKTQEIVLEMCQPETLEVDPENKIEVKRLEAESGMAFLLNDKNQVVKIEIPEQELELHLKGTKFVTP